MRAPTQVVLVLTATRHGPGDAQILTMMVIPDLDQCRSQLSWKELSAPEETTSAPDPTRRSYASAVLLSAIAGPNAGWFESVVERVA